MSATAMQIEGQSVTFDGYDGDDLVVRRINVWRDYDDRTKGFTCSVRHGHPAVLLERKGDACRIRTEWMGRFYEGWVTYWFLKELKTAWQLTRLLEATG